MLITAMMLVLIALARPVHAVSPDIVVSQVYGGGGNSGATLRNDFIELFNRGAAPVDVSTWSVQYASATGFSWQITPLSGILQPGQYYLVQQAEGTGGTVLLPPPDATGIVAMSASNGKVALVTAQIALTCGVAAGDCLPNSAIRDFVGYGGSANSFEGIGQTATLSNTTAALRAENGCTDTDNNFTDFAIGAPTPRNSAAAIDGCTGPVDLAGTGSANPASVAAGGTVLLTVTVTPASAPASTDITVNGDLTAIGEANLQAFFDDATNGDGIAGDNTFSFPATVAPSVTPGAKNLAIGIADAQARTASASIALMVEATPVAIYDIQGNGAESPSVGTQQTTTGIVTVILGSAFFMQDASGDGDPLTSDGLFIFTGSTLARSVAPGDQVTVTGTVAEFRPSSRPRDLTLTELTSVTLVKTGSGAPLPTPVLISDRPDTLISPDGIDSFEALEGMLVEVANPRVSGATTSFGELVVLAAGDANNTTPNGNLITESLGGDAVDYNPERIMIDDEARLPGGSGSGNRITDPQVQVAVGETASGSIIGALDYQFSNYRVQANHAVGSVFSDSAPIFISDLRPAQAFEGRIATFNVENLFDCVDAPEKDDRSSCSASALADLETQLSKLALAFEHGLGSPELVIVEETENTLVLTGDANGFVPGTTVSALLPRLIGNYSAVSFDASDGRGIEVGFIYNQDRVTLDNAFLATDLIPDSGGIFNGTVFRAGREPLVGFFTLDEVELIVVGNHFKSKGGPQFSGDANDSGDDPLYGAFQPPTRWTEEVRHRQADYVRELVDLLLQQHSGANILVGGDLNDFAFAEPGERQDTVVRIKDSATAPLVNVIDRIVPAQRYTFGFEGNSQVLDHILLNDAVAGLLRDQAIVHINADFPAGLGEDPAVVFRASDHDPLVAYLCTDATPPTLNVRVAPETLHRPNRHRLVTVKATLEVADNADPNVMTTLLSVTSDEPDAGLGRRDRPGDVVIVDDATFQLRAERSRRGDGRVYTISYQATDACGNSTNASTAVTVPR